MRAYVEIDTSRRRNLRAKGVQELLALVEMVRLCSRDLELLESLRDELARENGKPTGQVMSAVSLGMNGCCHHESDAFVEVPECRRKSAFP